MSGESANNLPDIAAVAALGEAMREGTGGPTVGCGIPAVYTYLGQFIAHDLTKMEQRAGQEPLNGRTAALDLDSLFGRIPSQLRPSTAAHHSAGLGLGPTANTKNARYSDLPRTPSGEAILPDPRNDHNLALAQVHVAITKFHQSVALLFPGRTAEEQRVITLRHFQSVVLLDYLERIIDPAVYRDVLDRGRVVVRPPPNSLEPFLISIEFAAACFRFGHSMVRDAYQPWSLQQETGVLEQLVRNTFRGGSLVDDGNGRKLNDSWVVEWPALVGLTPNNLMAAKIDTQLTQRLFDLTDWPWMLPPVKEGEPLESANLAARTLMRGHALRIPNAQSVIAHVRSLTRSGLELKSLSDDQLIEVSNPWVATCLTAGRWGKRLQNRTPLWFYVLREAEHFHGGRYLGPLASRIVMETIHAAIQAAPGGIIDEDGSLNFKAEASLTTRPDQPFKFADLIECVERVWHS